MSRWLFAALGWYIFLRQIQMLLRCRKKCFITIHLKLHNHHHCLYFFDKFDITYALDHFTLPAEDWSLWRVASYCWNPFSRFEYCLYLFAYYLPACKKTRKRKLFFLYRTKLLKNYDWIRENLCYLCHDPGIYNIIVTVQEQKGDLNSDLQWSRIFMKRC